MGDSDEQGAATDPPPYTLYTLDVVTMDSYVELASFSEQPALPLGSPGAALRSAPGSGPGVTTPDRCYLAGYNTHLASALGSSRFIIGCIILFLQTIATALYITFKTGGTLNIIATGVWCGLYVSQTCFLIYLCKTGLNIMNYF